MRKVCCTMVDFRNATHKMIWRNLLDAFENVVLWCMAINSDIVECKEEDEERKEFFKEVTYAMKAYQERVVQIHTFMTEELGYEKD